MLCCPHLVVSSVQLVLALCLPLIPPESFIDDLQYCLVSHPLAHPLYSTTRSEGLPEGRIFFIFLKVHQL